MSDILHFLSSRYKTGPCGWSKHAWSDGVFHRLCYSTLSCWRKSQNPGPLFLCCLQDNNGHVQGTFMVTDILVTLIIYNVVVMYTHRWNNSIFHSVI